jgi:hypothetical protein
MKTFLYNVPSYETGGVESIYQLCDAINNQGGDAYIFFVDDKYGDEYVPKRYKHYNLKLAKTVEDVKNNNVIIPEIFTDDFAKYRNANKFLFWLSVDINKGKFQDFQNPDIIHLFQSYYALDYLIKNKAVKYLPQFDYVNHEYIETQKEDFICYNPLKGIDITKAIVQRCPNIKFVALTNMTKEQLNTALAKAKIYIDFGHHPGRDRIPREAALSKCIVVTCPKGSAKYYSDVPTEPKFKLTQIDPDIEKYFTDIFKNYEQYNKQFDLYRRIINQQKEETFNQAKIFLN